MCRGHDPPCVNELAEDGHVIRIKGGVMSAAYHYGHDSETYAQSNKLIIAEKAMKLLKEDILVLIGGGTTAREFIKKIPNNLPGYFYNGECADSRGSCWTSHDQDHHDRGADLCL